jgi:hypothetical protein
MAGDVEGSIHGSNLPQTGQCKFRDMLSLYRQFNQDSFSVISMACETETPSGCGNFTLMADQYCPGKIVRTQSNLLLINIILTFLAVIYLDFG